MPIAAPLSTCVPRARRRRPKATVPRLATSGLVPVLLALVLYELPFFSSSGEVLCGCRGPETWDLPHANQGYGLELAPTIRLLHGKLTIDGRSLGSLRALTQDLETLRRVGALVRRDEGPRSVTIAAAPGVPYGTVRQIAETAAAAGMTHVSFLVSPLSEPTGEH